MSTTLITTETISIDSASDQIAHVHLTANSTIFAISTQKVIFGGKSEQKGTILGATLLNDNTVEHAINWSGGLHHAKRAEASG